MPIWKLTPVDLTDDNWKASKYKCEVIVRAATEKRAREIVYFETLEYAERSSPVGDTLIAPWHDPDSVKCEQLNSSEYPEDGPEEILVPKAGRRPSR